MGYTVERYHDFCAGHRVHGHESKCAHLHGHNYRVYFHCRAVAIPPPPQMNIGYTTFGSKKQVEVPVPVELDSIGRVIDFSVVKECLCNWLEEEWDHKFLVWEHDPASLQLLTIDRKCRLVPFNPTAENMAQYLVNVVGPAQLAGTGVELFKCVVQETRKCSASYELK